MLISLEDKLKEMLLTVPHCRGTLFVLRSVMISQIGMLMSEEEEEEACWVPAGEAGLVCLNHQKFSSLLSVWVLRCRSDRWRNIEPASFLLRDVLKQFTTAESQQGSVYPLRSMVRPLEDKPSVTDPRSAAQQRTHTGVLDRPLLIVAVSCIWGRVEPVVKSNKSCSDWLWAKGLC